MMESLQNIVYTGSNSSMGNTTPEFKTLALDSRTPHVHADLTMENVLLQNCIPDWREWTCMVANICGLTSTTLWFIVLLPQIWKNFKRKSVMGLSALWATANFTASLTNLFFVYMYADIPLYGKINSIYMPILEFIMLSQFWLYGDHYERKSKILYTVFCFVLWGTIIGVQLGLRRFEEMQWLAIALWCIETFPQVILNIKIRSTTAQSTQSVAIAIVGKTTDFISTYWLVMPLQYVIMAYFSSSVAFVNGIQVAWYYQDNNLKKIRKRHPSRDVEHSAAVHPVLAEVEDRGDNHSHLDEDDISVRYGELLHTYNQCRFIRRVVVIALGLILVIFAAGLVWNTGTFYALFAPVGIIAVVCFGHLYYKTKTSTWRYSPLINRE